MTVPPRAGLQSTVPLAIESATPETRPVSSLNAGTPAADRAPATSLAIEAKSSGAGPSPTWSRMADARRSRWWIALSAVERASLIPEWSGVVDGPPKLGLASGSVHGAAQLAHGLGDADENRAADYGVADVHRAHLRDRRHRPDIRHREAVAGIDGEANRVSAAGRFAQRLERRRVVGEVRVATGVQLDHRRAEVAGAVHGVDRRIDEQADENAGVGQALDAATELARGRAKIQAAFGGDLLSLFRHEGRLARLQPERDADHLVGAGHLEVENTLDLTRQPLDVGVLDVPAIFAEVGRDPIRARSEE